ncbi:MAG TPA: hypothetical protein VMT89_05430, partial [Candidatus Acidoferrales bacterium]|nr:hypothetical protein [Candidatus Acidoferrales bacterium]
PGMRAYGDLYNSDISVLTKHFVAIRQEEHRMFLATVEPDGKALAQLIERGVIPPDTYVAMPCVGAIAYFGNLRTLDTLGLTDSHVAHQARDPLRPRMMAHSKAASDDYMLSRGVDIISEGVHIVSYDSMVIETAISHAKVAGTEDFYLSHPLSDGARVFGRFPGSWEHIKLRFPGLKLALLRTKE